LEAFPRYFAGRAEKKGSGTITRGGQRRHQPLLEQSLGSRSARAGFILRGKNGLRLNGLRRVGCRKSGGGGGGGWVGGGGGGWCGGFWGGGVDGGVGVWGGGGCGGFGVCFGFVGVWEGQHAQNTSSPRKRDERQTRGADEAGELPKEGGTGTNPSV